jgi:hypothetical protein
LLNSLPKVSCSSPLTAIATASKRDYRAENEDPLKRSFYI